MTSHISGGNSAAWLSLSVQACAARHSLSDSCWDLGLRSLFFADFIVFKFWRKELEIIWSWLRQILKTRRPKLRMASLLMQALRRRKTTAGTFNNLLLCNFHWLYFSVDGKAKGMMCLVTGKRHLICQDIGSAVESLGEFDCHLSV